MPRRSEPMNQDTTTRTVPWVVCLALVWGGCSSTVASASLDGATVDTAPPDAATTGEDGGAETDGVRDASVDADAAPTACPPSPPRPGLCARDGLACSYPNGCTYRCRGGERLRAAWYSTAGCW